jgi:hypothetical protein
MVANRLHAIFGLPEELLPIRHKITNGTGFDQEIGCASRMVSGTRPRVVLSMLDHMGADWVTLHIAHDREQVMVILDGKRVKALLE